MTARSLGKMPTLLAGSRGCGYSTWLKLLCWRVVFDISDGNDPDWATWYADWLVNLSSLADQLGARPVRSELTFVLVALDKEYTRDAPSEKWEDFYAERLIEHFAPAADMP